MLSMKFHYFFQLFINLFIAHELQTSIDYLKREKHRPQFLYYRLIMSNNMSLFVLQC